jgi:aspartate-semialdehyde dehydrogenase
MGTGIRVAVVGATGAVGRQTLEVLEQRGFPVAQLKLYASGRSAGSTLEFAGDTLVVENLAGADFRGIELVLSAPGAAVSREFAPKAVAAGAVVVDKSAAFRMDPDVPLVVPEVNGEAVKAHKGIIASPNCSTIQLVVALWPLHRAFGLKRVVVSTYQAVSGAGQKAVDELLGQVAALLNHRPVEIRALPHQIAFNVLPQVETFRPGDGGFSTEETKLIGESRRILGLPGLRITATCARVPVLNGHSESVNVEFERPATPDAVREALAAAPGVRVVDDPVAGEYPMVLDATGGDDVLVGRVREDASADNACHLWIAGDNLRKGASLNAVQIAELLFGVRNVQVVATS